MKLTFRTKRRLRNIGLIALTVATVLAVTWLCCVIWLERYVVYSADGAKLDFDLEEAGFGGVVAKPPEAQGSISIYYNEGSDAVEISKELSSINGYYLDYSSMSKDMAGAFDDLEFVPAGTPIMIELKGGYGSFYYTTKLSGASQSASVPIASVDEFIQKLKDKGYYMIAKISAFQDYDFGNRNVPSGLYMLSRAGLWMDTQGCFWLDPTNSNAVGWITSVVLELKEMGFHEVMLSNFRFPDSDKYIFNGDKTAALQSAMSTLIASTASEGFTLSFGTNDATFSLPEGTRTRLYLEGVEAKDVATKAGQVTITDPEVRLVFLATTNDTRFDDYSVLRPLSAAEILEAQKADMAKGTDEEG